MARKFNFGLHGASMTAAVYESKSNFIIISREGSSLNKGT